MTTFPPDAVAYRQMQRFYSTLTAVPVGGKELAQTALRVLASTSLVCIQQKNEKAIETEPFQFHVNCQLPCYSCLEVVISRRCLLVVGNLRFRPLCAPSLSVGRLVGYSRWFYG